MILHRKSRVSNLKSLVISPHCRVTTFCHGIVRRLSPPLEHPLCKPPLILCKLVEHNITTAPTDPTSRPRRPDLSTFFSTLELVDTSNTQNSNAVPVPGDVSAAFRTLAGAFERMRQDNGGGDGENGSYGGFLEQLIQELLEDADLPPREVKGVSDEFLAGESKRRGLSCSLRPGYRALWRLQMFDECVSLTIYASVELDRVPKQALKKSDVCPICNNQFLEGQYSVFSNILPSALNMTCTDKFPLVVRLPCHKSHIFDLECIEPWLKLHPTCPLDRKDLLKKKAPPPPPPAEEEEADEYDDMYA